MCVLGTPSNKKRRPSHFWFLRGRRVPGKDFPERSISVHDYESGGYMVATFRAPDEIWDILMAAAHARGLTLSAFLRKQEEDFRGCGILPLMWFDSWPQLCNHVADLLIEIEVLEQYRDELADDEQFELIANGIRTLFACSLPTQH